MTTGRPRGGFMRPVSVTQFILEYLRTHGEAYSGEMHRAFKDWLVELAREKDRKQPYHKPTYPSFYRKVWGLAKDGLIEATGRQEEADVSQFRDWDAPPMRVFYRLKR